LLGKLEVLLNSGGKLPKDWQSELLAELICNEARKTVEALGQLL
jgi:hypothetical protein